MAYPLSLPNQPGIFICVDYFGPPPLTPRGNAYVLLVTDCFSRRDDMCTATGTHITATGTVNILIDQSVDTSLGIPRHAHLRQRTAA